MGVSRAYLDTYYPLEVVFEGEHKKYVEHLLSQINNSSFGVLIPQIVFGKTASQICEKCDRRAGPGPLLQRLASVMEKYGWTDADMPPPSNESLRMTEELLRVDDRLTGVDAVILAQALADPDSKFLFTRDNTLLNNKAICDYELRLRNDGRRNTRVRIAEYL